MKTRRVEKMLRLSPELNDRLASAAAERDVSVNWMITQAVTEFLSRLLPVEQIEWTQPRTPLNHDTA